MKYAVEKGLFLVNTNKKYKVIKEKLLQVLSLQTRI
jgi:hypothetical protein